MCQGRSIAALWCAFYLTNIEFLFLFTAYGREDELLYALAVFGQVVNEQMGGFHSSLWSVSVGWQARRAGGRAGHADNGAVNRD
jgi:hypothetical protein